MAAARKPIPEGFHTLSPHLTVRDATKAIEFYKKGFGAQVLGVHHTPDGKVMHAALKIGDSILMLNDEFPGMSAPSPQGLGGTTVTINIYTEDADRVYNQAVSAGATVAMPLKDQFWGDRYGLLTDPFGHRWAVATHKEDVTPAEMEQRSKAFFAQMGKSTGASH